MRSGKYIAATADELAAGTRADKVAGGVSQKALFRRHGEVEFDGDTLILRSGRTAGTCGSAVARSLRSGVSSPTSTAGSSVACSTAGNR